ncbi:SIR2 family protein [Shewanella putrefaciens]|nr:SIR2 family protein [Shewanella putrefaciens]
MSIETIYFKESIAEQTIRNLHEKDLLIPFFGAGFTKGSASNRATVPDANKMIESIKKIAMQNNKKLDEYEDISSINDLKTAYQVLLDEEYVENIKRRTFLENSFSNVRIEFEKKKLLKKGWKRIYTFNIDDGIENTNLGYQVICPFRDVSMEFIEGNKCLMKIHGDITEYLKYNDTSIIFSWLEYAKSIEDNKAMVNILMADAKNSSLLFIGCSLDKEIDLMLVAAKHRFENSIFLMKGQPNLSNRKNLETYGIKKVIWFDEYEEIYKWLNMVISDEVTNEKHETINIEAIKGTRESTIKYIANGGPVIRGKNEITLNDSNTKRDIIDDIRKSLSNYNIIIIEGRRFSGKTTLAVDIYQTFSEYRSYIYHNNMIGNADNLESDITVIPHLIFDLKKLDGDRPF